MARRKRLLGLDALEQGNKLLDLGVPLTKVYKELNLDDKWTYRSTADIFNADREGLYLVTRPPWLEKEPLIQEAPDNWTFEGLFPNGKWIKLN